MSDQAFQELFIAQSCFVSGLYPLAKEKFTKILESNPDSNDVLIPRAYTNIKLACYEDAVKDAEAAVKKSANFDGLLVLAISLFYLRRFDEALQTIQKAGAALSSAGEGDAQRVQCQIWEQKIKAEINKKFAIDSGNLIKKVEEQKVDKPAPSHPQAGKVTYKWHQTDNRIYIEINFALKKKEDLNIKIESKSVAISFPTSESSSFELNLSLFDEIDAAQSTYNVQLNKIEIQLEKIIKGRNWTLLERSDSTNERILETAMPKPVQSQTNQAAPAYPSSSKTKKDWSKIDKEIEEDMKKNKDDYAEGDQLNAFFKQIYSGADEKTRMAMMKSFQTSGGTVLSTNWDEVKDKDYEGKDRPSAPDGQEYKQWGK